MIKQPIWARDSFPTRRGWMRGTELLKAQQITQDQIDEYNDYHFPEETPEVAEEVIEVVEETPTEEVEETPTEEVEESPEEEETPTEEVEETPEESEVVEETADETPSEEVEETPEEEETPTEEVVEDEPVEEVKETVTEETEVSTQTLLTEAPISGKKLEDMNEADLANVVQPVEDKEGKSND